MKNNIFEKLENKKDIVPVIGLLLFFFYANISAAINWILSGLFGTTTDVFRLLALAVVGMLFVVSVFINFKEIPKDSFAVTGIFAVLYAISMLNSRTAGEIMRQNLLPTTFVECIPIYILYRMIRNKRLLWDWLKIFGNVTLVFYIISFFLYNVGDTNNYRTFSSGLMLVAAVSITEWLYNSNKWYMINSILSCVLIATCGRRSSLVSLLLLVMIILYLKKDIRSLVIIAIAGSILLIFGEQLIKILYEICVGFGVRPRILIRIMAGTIDDDSHRFEQWGYVFQLLFDQPVCMLTGLGIVGERSYMRSNFPHMENFGYPHDIIVELMGHYGLLFGTLITLFLLWSGPVRVFKTFKHDRYVTGIFLFVLSLASALLFQDSYVQNKFFFLYLAVIVSAFMKKKSVIQREILILRIKKKLGMDV